MTEITVELVMSDPRKGDMIAYDGEKWCVARRDWIQIHVPDPALEKFLRKERDDAERRRLINNSALACWAYAIEKKEAEEKMRESTNG